MNKIFVGAFNKKNNFCEREWAHAELHLDYTIDPLLFGKVADKITQILGSKAKYTVQDAYRYFHEAYYAYQIDYRQFYNYCRASAAKLFDISEATISDDSDIELLAEPDGRFFSFLTDGRPTDEKPLTLVIDNSFLRALSETAYGNSKTTSGNSESVSDNSKNTSDDNLILVIGTFDGETINSMKVILSPNFPEIEYALEFFRLHS